MHAMRGHHLKGLYGNIQRVLLVPCHSPCVVRPTKCRRQPVPPSFSKQPTSVPGPSAAIDPNALPDIDALAANDSPLVQLADLFVETINPTELEDVETLYQLPEDIAMHLNHLITTVAPKTPKGTFCTNCCVPLRGPTCAVCGHSAKADSVVVGPEVTNVWNQHLAQATPLHSSSRRRSRNNAAVGLAFDERMLLHHASLSPYPERPERLKAILTRLEATGLISRCKIMAAREASDSELEAVHTKDLIRALSRFSEHAQTLPAAATLPLTSPLAKPAPKPANKQQDFVISADALCSASTYTAARLAAGVAADMAQALAKGRMDHGVAVVRPPGHHATRTTAQSGCYFNNAAVAARAAQAAGADRVMILDWDIHHGYGTQEIFEEDTGVMYVSMHRADEEFYPGTGQVTDVGVNDGEGYTINIPWQDNSITGVDYVQAMLHVVMPVAYEFQPDLVIISAGFDGAVGDPLGGCTLTPEFYAHMIYMLKGLAPTLMVLEGGYNLDVTAKCTEACVRVLLGERPPRLDGPWEMSKAGTVALMNAMQVQSEFWPCVHPLSLNGWMTAIREQQEQAEDEGEGEEDVDEANAKTLRDLLQMAAGEDKDKVKGVALGKGGLTTPASSKAGDASSKGAAVVVEQEEDMTDSEIMAFLMAQEQEEEERQQQQQQQSGRK